jgi:hypothetical protein
LHEFTTLRCATLYPCQSFSFLHAVDILNKVLRISFVRVLVALLRCVSKVSNNARNYSSLLVVHQLQLRGPYLQNTTAAHTSLLLNFVSVQLQILANQVNYLRIKSQPK